MNKSVFIYHQLLRLVWWLSKTAVFTIQFFFTKGIETGKVTKNPQMLDYFGDNTISSGLLKKSFIVMFLLQIQVLVLIVGFGVFFIRFGGAFWQLSGYLLISDSEIQCLVEVFIKFERRFTIPAIENCLQHSFRRKKCIY